MITLCTNNFCVIYRSSLRPKNDCCFAAKCARKMQKYVVCFFHFRFDCLNWLWYSIDIIFKWNHIYHCYKTDFINKYRFAELCFQCDKWFPNNLKWYKHCHNQFENFETFSIQCNSLFKHLIRIEMCFIDEMNVLQNSFDDTPSQKYPTLKKFLWH